MKNAFELSWSINRALLGVITNNIKAIVVFIDGMKTLNLCVYFYNEPTDAEIEDMKVVETEVGADFREEVQEYKDEFIVWDGKDHFNTKKNLVYCRKD